MYVLQQRTLRWITVHVNFADQSSQLDQRLRLFHRVYRHAVEEGTWPPHNLNTNAKCILFKFLQPSHLVRSSLLGLAKVNRQTVYVATF